MLTLQSIYVIDNLEDFYGGFHLLGNLTFLSKMKVLVPKYLSMIVVLPNCLQRYTLESAIMSCDMSNKTGLHPSESSIWHLVIVIAHWISAPSAPPPWYCPDGKAT